jgi:hypothetical protein
MADDLAVLLIDIGRVEVADWQGEGIGEADVVGAAWHRLPVVVDLILSGVANVRFASHGSLVASVLEYRGHDGQARLDQGRTVGDHVGYQKGAPTVASGQQDDGVPAGRMAAGYCRPQVIAPADISLSRAEFGLAQGVGEMEMAQKR